LPFPIRYSSLVNSKPQTYRYTIQVAGDGTDPKLLKLVFAWKGEWQHVDAYEDKSDA